MLNKRPNKNVESDIFNKEITEIFEFLHLGTQEDREKFSIQWRFLSEDKLPEPFQMVADDTSCSMDEGGNCNA